MILSNNNVGDRGAKRIAAAIENCQILLQTLDLSHNKIGHRAALALGQALSCNSLLSALHLEANEIGPAGGDALARGLTSRSLTFLSLGRNDLGDPGCAAVAKVKW